MIEKVVKKIALRPMATKFGPKKVNSLHHSQGHIAQQGTEWHHKVGNPR